MEANPKYKRIAMQYGTPYYVFELKELYGRVKEIKSILGESMRVCYAMKANPFLISYLDGFVDKFEVCSPGEYEICKKEGISFSKIVLSGVYKEEVDLRKTFEDGFAGVYTLESKQQCDLLYRLAQEYNKKIHVLPRLTSGNQFGMNKEDIEEIMNNPEYGRFFVIGGIHYFSGTQKKNHMVIENELKDITDFCSYIKNKSGRKIEKLEYGPGLFIDYFGDMIETLEEIRYLASELDKISEKMEITIELGRYMTALCGKYVTQVVDVKNNRGINYAITDGGIHHLAYHGQMLGIKVPRISVLHGTGGKRIQGIWVVCGALCSVNDVLLKNYETEALEEGDIFVFHDAGAYAMTDTNALFLSRELPVILVEHEDESIECIRKRIHSACINVRSCQGEIRA